METKKIPSLPRAPGIYLFKDKEQNVIYIGKAKSLKNRVSSYFKKYTSDWKIAALLGEYESIDFILTKNEPEALLLEAQLIQQHKPKYNVLLKEGQPFVYLLFTQRTPCELLVVRNKKDKGRYFGPFLQKMQARKVHEYLVKTFKLNLCNKKIENGCLDYHIGRCAGSCMATFDMQDHAFRIELAIDVLKNNHRDFLKKIKEQIAIHNKKMEFEKARNLHQYLENLDAIFATIRTKFSEDKFENEIFVTTTPKPIEAPNRELAQKIQQFLHLDHPVFTIDCFDISHFQSSAIVGSCVRFRNGMPDKNNFRRFKIKSLKEQNDYAALQEIVTRRYRDAENIPDLILIDGGKGQLSAVKDLVSTTIISLAKREERIFSDAFPEGIKLDLHDEVGKIFIAIRDYAHHFAVTYHRKRRSMEKSS